MRSPCRLRWTSEEKDKNFNSYINGRIKNVKSDIP
jgi:hypothetical protein